ncbi:macrophage mannose receptor 1-like, partial [Acipenser oxyrinchus oxyrinchus]
ERYTLIEELKTWTEAQQYCREHHTDLVSIKNASENQEIVKKAQGKPFWIGLFNEPWKWSHQGDNYTFHSWGNGEPNNWGGGEKCVIMSKSCYWYDISCNTQYPFFCCEGKDSCSRYTLIEELKTWTEAQQYCREHHTDLVSIKNASENQEIVKKVQGKPFWIGLFNEPWKWSHQGDNYTFQNWKPGDPNNDGGNQKCVNMLNSGKWIDYDCNSQLPFFCYDGKDPCSVCVLVQLSSCSLFVPQSVSRDHLILP